MTPLEIALGYIQRGWNPVPIPLRAKKPNGNRWQQRIITAETASRYFNSGPMNIGVLQGPSSGGLNDVDLDCPEAIAVASYVLPRTDAVFGRASKRRSHFLYRTDLASKLPKAAEQLKDPTLSKSGDEKAMLAELRIGGGGKGAQTVFPGSVHASGEAIEWDVNGEPAPVDGEDLLGRVRKIAAYSLLARYWPRLPGNRSAALEPARASSSRPSASSPAGYGRPRSPAAMMPASSTNGSPPRWSRHTRPCFSTTSTPRNSSRTPSPRH